MVMGTLVGGRGGRDPGWWCGRARPRSGRTTGEGLNSSRRCAGGEDLAGKGLESGAFGEGVALYS